MRKFKKWLYENFLPMWAKQTMQEENEKLKEEIIRLKAKVKELDAYASGLEMGLRTRNKITINNGEVSK